MYYFVYAYVDTDTFNEGAKKELSELNPLLIRFNHLENVLFKGWLGALSDRLPEIIESEPINKAHVFYLTEAAEQSKYLMSAGEEKLAGELLDAANNAGSSVRKREETHRMAEANRAFSHYRI